MNAVMKPQKENTIVFNDFDFKQLLKSNVLERNIQITKKVLAGTCYKELADTFKCSVQVIVNVTVYIIDYVQRCVEQPTLEQVFSREKYPEAYTDKYSYSTSISGNTRQSRKKNIFNLAHVPIFKLHEEREFLIPLIDAMYIQILKKRNTAAALPSKSTSKYHIYFSERNFPLLYVGEPLDVPVITLENYTKWYEIYMVTSNGQVKKVPISIVQEVMEKYTDALWHDHHIHPRLLYRIAALIGGCVDERAIEVAAGRWMIERIEDDKYNFTDPGINEVMA